MALTKDFRVKDSLNVGISGLFSAGGTVYNPLKVAIDTYGKILSGGRDLDTIFNKTLPVLSNGAGVIGFAYDGTATKTIALSGAASLTSGQHLVWSSSTGFVNSSLSETQLSGLNTAVAVNSASWTSVYTSYRGASGSLVNNITAPQVQGQVAVTNLSGGTITVTLSNLGAGANPQFGTVNATQFIGGGGGLTGVTATPTFPGTGISDLASTHYFFVNDNTGGTGAVTGNKRILYSDLLTDLAGTGLAVAADSDSIILKNSTSLTNNTITFWDSSAGQLTNSVITTNAGVISVGGSLSANGNFGVTGSTVLAGALSVKGDIILGDAATDTLTVNAGPINIPNATAAADAIILGTDVNLYRSAADVLRTDDSVSVGGNLTVTGSLSVVGDFTYLDTVVSVTSALSVLNFGTGPALRVEQTGINPVAQFIDRDGGAVTIYDTGSLGIGTPIGVTPTHKLTVGGTISASNTLILAGLVTNVTSSNSVIVENSGTLEKRAIQAAAFGASTLATASTTGTTNRVTKFTSGSNVGDSSITDTGTLVSLTTDVSVLSGKLLTQNAVIGAVSTSTATFAKLLSSGANALPTFLKSNLQSVKYFVTLSTGAQRTAFETIVAYDGTASHGSVYGIVDAQATSLLTDTDVTFASTTSDVQLTVSSACSAIIYGHATYVA